MIIKKLLIIILFLMVIPLLNANAVIDQVLSQSWEHYKEFKIQDNGRPLADRDTNDLGNGSKGTYITFSETISYVLFRAVWMDDKEAFDKAWKWSYDNMMRKNIDVFDWHTQSWRKMPEEKRDNLFAWRWVDNINNQGKGGVIYYKWRKENEGKLWRAGYDVAPDGDELIAGALIFAYKRWGNTGDKYDYMTNAQNILKDLWEKCVIYFVPGQLEGFDSKTSFGSWFSFADDGYHVNMDIVKSSTGKGLYAEAYGSQYMGLGKSLGNVDLTTVDGLTFRAQGADYIKIVLEDKKGLKATIVKNIWNDDWDKIAFSFRDMSSPRGFDWKNVKSVMFQPSGDEMYLDDIRLYGGEIVGNPGYHLTSNDQGQPWINVSYYMPFLYEIFAKYDTDRPWKELITASYYDIEKSKKCTLSNNAGESFTNNRALVPDWFMYSFTGEVVDIPWAVDNFVDDYLCSWDAFRTWYFMSMHSTWFQSHLFENIMKYKTYEFFKQELADKGYINGGYYISGETGDIRGIKYEYAGINGAYLAFFSAVGDKQAATTMYERMQKKYKEAGYWENNPNDYYSQNWAWFGLAFYKDHGKELLDLLGS